PMELHDGVVSTTTDVWNMLAASRDGDLGRGHPDDAGQGWRSPDARTAYALRRARFRPLQMGSALLLQALRDRRLLVGKRHESQSHELATFHAAARHGLHRRSLQGRFAA